MITRTGIVLEVSLSCNLHIKASNHIISTKESGLKQQLHVSLLSRRTASNQSAHVAPVSTVDYLRWRQALVGDSHAFAHGPKLLRPKSADTKPTWPPSGRRLLPSLTTHTPNTYTNTHIPKQTTWLLLSRLRRPSYWTFPTTISTPLL